MRPVGRGWGGRDNIRATCCWIGVGHSQAGAQITFDGSQRSGWQVPRGTSQDGLDRHVDRLTDPGSHDGVRCRCKPDDRRGGGTDDRAGRDAGNCGGQVAEPDHPLRFLVWDGLQAAALDDFAAFDDERPFPGWEAACQVDAGHIGAGADREGQVFHAGCGSKENGSRGDEKRKDGQNGKGSQAEKPNADTGQVAPASFR